ncbi:MAG: hypothetical protein U0232_16980 [Thermomicrobiales bacterium]
MGSAIEFEMMAFEQSNSMIRGTSRLRAEEADRTSTKRGIVAVIFGRRRAAESGATLIPV